MSFKSGFINIIGRPNVGKSTLINNLLNEKLSVINAKAQTTRHRIIGIYTGEDFQMIVSDTPGIIKPNYNLQSAMMNFVKDIYSDADILLLLVEPKHKLEDLELIKDKFENSKAKKYLILNKIDLVKEEKIDDLMDFWKNEVQCDYYLPISALEEINIEKLFESLKNDLPEHPAYYPEDTLTDKPMRFFISEIIREKILSNYKNEIPYSVEVVIDSFKEEEKITKIYSTIITNKKTHKPILIGKGGKMLKKVGTEARIEMEEFLGTKVYLELFVKIKEDWRDNERILKQMGYE